MNIKSNINTHAAVLKLSSGRSGTNVAQIFLLVPLKKVHRIGVFKW